MVEKIARILEPKIILSHGAAEKHMMIWSEFFVFWVGLVIWGRPV
jgi:hypothetical protein